MIKLGKSVIAALVMGALIAGLFSCQKNEGPAERAGKQIDKAVEKAGQQMQKAGEKIEDAVKDANKNCLREARSFNLPMAAYRPNPLRVWAAKSIDVARRSGF